MMTYITVISLYESAIIRKSSKNDAATMAFSDLRLPCCASFLPPWQGVVLNNGHLIKDGFTIGNLYVVFIYQDDKIFDLISKFPSH